MELPFAWMGLKTGMRGVTTISSLCRKEQESIQGDCQVKPFCFHCISISEILGMIMLDSHSEIVWSK